MARRRAIAGCIQDLPCCARLWLRRRRRLSRPAAKRNGINGAYHLPLDDLVLVDGDVADTRDILHVDVLQRAAQLLCSGHGLAVAIADVEVDVTPNVASQARAKYRIQAYRQFDGSTQLVE